MFTRRIIALWVIALMLMPIFAFAASNTEVVSMRTEYAKTFSNGDGSFTSYVSLKPIHYKDATGNWNDIGFKTTFLGVSKVAIDSTQINYPYMDAGRDSNGNYVFADQDGGNDDGYNIVGNTTDRYGEPERTYRQIFRWDISFMTDGGTITISDMYYSFGNINSSTVPDTLAVTKVETDPSGWSAASVWNNTTMWTPFKYVRIDATGTAKKYKVDLSGDISTLQGRANNTTFKDDRSDLWYAVHHKMKTEGSVHGLDVCSSVDTDLVGHLVITWSISFPKVANVNDRFVSVNPNPFNPRTILSFTLDKPGHTKLEIFSINGQKISTLANNYLQAGLHSYTFDGTHLSSGMYFYRFSSTEFSKSGKFMLIK